jgi:hypothetical protein
MLLRPAIRFMSTHSDLSKTICARIHKPITVANLNPDTACHPQTEYPQFITYTVARDKFADLVKTLKETEGVSFVNGEKTAYGEKVEPDFIYRQNFGGTKAF